MPVKRRSDKRRIDPHAEAEAWASVLDCGYDYFDDLAPFGIATDHVKRPEASVAAAAWARLGYLIEEIKPGIASIASQIIADLPVGADFTPKETNR